MLIINVYISSVLCNNKIQIYAYMYGLYNAYCVIISWCVPRLSSMMEDVNTEKVKLTGAVESMEKIMEEKDREILSLKTEASPITSVEITVLLW